MKVALSRKILIAASFLGIGLFVLLFLILNRGGNHQKVFQCANDGLRINPLYEVQFSMKDSSVYRFCSIVCALQAFDRLKENIALALVTDEVSGQKVNAEKAFFIESRVVTVPHVKNRIHVFASEPEAVHHRDEYSGKHINNPFILFNPWREETIAGRKIRIKIDPLTGLTRIIKGNPYITVLKGLDLNTFDETGATKCLESLIALLRDYLDVKIDELKFAGMERIGGT